MIPNNTVNAPAIVSISAMNAGIVCLFFVCSFVSIFRIIDINSFNFLCEACNHNYVGHVNRHSNLSEKLNG